MPSFARALCGQFLQVACVCAFYTYRIVALGILMVWLKEACSYELTDTLLNTDLSSMWRELIL